MSEACNWFHFGTWKRRIDSGVTVHFQSRLLPIEGGDVLVSLFGWCGESAPATDAGMQEYAGTLPQQEIAEFLKSAERKTDFRTFHYKEARRLRIDRRPLPPRTCLMGDALCTVDPVFGQGMTLAALQAYELSKCFEGSTDLGRSAREFNRNALRATDTAWLLSTGEDFRYPEVKGKRPPGIAVSHWYTRGIHRLVAQDDEVYRRFARVMNLLAGPLHLFHPRVATKVLLSSLRPPKPVVKRPTGC